MRKNILTFTREIPSPLELENGSSSSSSTHTQNTRQRLSCCSCCCWVDVDCVVKLSRLEGVDCSKVKRKVQDKQRRK